jgi:hypothetical protein
VVSYRVRIGFLDLSAAILLGLALVIPSPARAVRALYFKPQAALATQIAEAQAALSRDPKDGVAAASLADLLVAAHQTDWAIRTGAVAADSGSPTAWRAAVSVSAAYMDRRDIGPAYEWAARALTACEAAPADACGDDDRGRVEMYARALRAVRDSGVDVKKSSKGIIEAVDRAVPLIRLGKKP